MSWLWVVIIALFIVSFVGLLFPLIPSALALWGGFLLFAFGIDRHELSLWFWLSAVVLTIVILGADVLANQFFVKKYGGSKRGERMAILGVIGGSFFFPPFGIIFIPLILVFITELIVSKKD